MQAPAKGVAEGKKVAAAPSTFLRALRSHVQAHTSFSLSLSRSLFRVYRDQAERILEDDMVNKSLSNPRRASRTAAAAASLPPSSASSSSLFNNYSEVPTNAGGVSRASVCCVFVCAEGAKGARERVCSRVCER